MAESSTKSGERKSSTAARKGSGGTPTRARTRAKPASSGEKSAFFGGNTAALVGAAVAGAAFGLAANRARKLIMQSPAFVSGTWDEALKTEHKMTLALFDQLEATSDDAAATRAGLVMKLKYSLSKHALQEENVIYPALRDANETHDADELNSEHGYVKTYLYDLETMTKDGPAFLDKVRDFRALLERHIRDEEDRIFPRLRSLMNEEQTRKLTLKMNKEGLKLA